MDVHTALYNITPLLRTIMPYGQIRAAFGYRLWNFKLDNFWCMFQVLCWFPGVVAHIHQEKALKPRRILEA